MEPAGPIQKKKRNIDFDEVVGALVDLLEDHSEFVKGHSQRVAGNALLLARKVDLPKDEIETIYYAGLLHDIGLIEVPRAILEKPEKLLKEEWEAVQEHPALGERFLSRISVFRNILPIVRHHHENYDGSGYPDGLKGDQIPIGARILALVDSYDAMISRRPYRTVRPWEEARDDLLSHVETRYDGELTRAFIEVVESNPSIEEDLEKARRANAIRMAVQGVIARFRKREVELPIPSKVAAQIEKVLRDPLSGTGDIAEVIETDAAVSLKLIGIANSVVYRGSEKVTSVRQAIPRLGMDETSRMVKTIVNRNLYHPRHNHLDVLMVRLWTHSLACAIGSRHIATHLRVPLPDTLFFMGLIHDVGKTILAEALGDLPGSGEPSPYQVTYDDFIDVIQQVHTGFGEAVLRRWNFSDAFLHVVTTHEAPRLSAGAGKEPVIVHVANMMTREIGYSLHPSAGIPLHELEGARFLNLDAGVLSQVAEETAELMTKYAGAFY